MADVLREYPLTALLRGVYNLLASRIFARIAAHPAYGDIRPVHGNVLEQLEVEDGLRLTDLAGRAGMTPQSMGQLVDDLERLGYLERRPDPEDRRAKRIDLTRRGQENVRTAKRVAEEMERDLIELLGEARFRHFRRALEVIAAAEGLEQAR